MSRLLLLILASALALAFFLREERRGSLVGFEKSWVEWLEVNAGAPSTTAPSVTLVEIDDPNGQIFESWPLSPGDYALIAQNLRAYGTPVVAFTEPLRWSEKGLLFDSLVSQLEGIPHPILAAELVYVPAESDFIDPAIGTLLPTMDSNSASSPQLTSFTGIDALPQDRVRTSAELSFTTLSHPDLSQSTDTIPLLARYGDQAHPSIILTALAAAQDIPLSDITATRSKVNLGTTSIPITPSGHLKIDPETLAQIPRIDAGTLLLGPNPDPDLLGEGETLELLDTLSTNLCIVGVTTKTTDTTALSLPESIAAAIATIQTESFIARVALPIEQALWGASALLGLFAGFQGRATIRYFLIGVAGIILGNVLLFKFTSLWFSPIIPIALLITPILIGILRPRAKKPPVPTAKEV